MANAEPETFAFTAATSVREIARSLQAPDCPASTLDDPSIWSDDSCTPTWQSMCRVAIASRVDNTAERWRRLAQDPQPEVVLTVARNPFAPPRILDRLSRREDCRRLAWHLPANPALPYRALRRLIARHGSVAANGVLPSVLVLALERDDITVERARDLIYVSFAEFVNIDRGIITVDSPAFTALASTLTGQGLLGGFPEATTVLPLGPTPHAAIRALFDIAWTTLCASKVENAWSVSVAVLEHLLPHVCLSADDLTHAVRILADPDSGPGTAGQRSTLVCAALANPVAPAILLADMCVRQPQGWGRIAARHPNCPEEARVVVALATT